MYKHSITHNDLRHGLPLPPSRLAPFGVLALGRGEGRGRLLSDLQEWVGHLVLARAEERSSSSTAVLASRARAVPITLMWAVRIDADRPRSSVRMASIEHQSVE